MKGRWTASDQDHRSQITIVFWSLVWVVTFLLASTSLKRGWITGTTATVGVTAAAALIQAGWLWSYVQFLRNSDELMRRIQIDAMAGALGAGMLVGFSQILLDQGGVADVTMTPVLMSMIGAYVVLVVVGQLRYSGSGE